MWRPDRLARVLERAEVGPVRAPAIGVGTADDDDVGLRERGRIGAEADVPRLAHRGGRGLVADLAGREPRDARGVDVVADRAQALAELDGQRQADVAEADDRDDGIGRRLGARSLRDGARFRACLDHGVPVVAAAHRWNDP
jgi:hypothetical protein